MRKFKHETSGEIVTLEELEKKLDYQVELSENFKDEELFEDWLASENYTLIDIWELTASKKMMIKQQYFEYCKEITAVDLNYEEIFVN